MRGISRVVVIGRLGKDPELREGKSGTQWSAFSVATNRMRKEGEQWHEETDWHDIKVFGEDAQRCQRFLRKGSIVAVDGSLVYDTWVDDTNVKRRKARIIANRVQFLADLRTPADPETPAVEVDAAVPPVEEESAEIPF